jgi:hypothetical protein
MKRVVVCLILILLSSSVFADWNAAYNNTCGNKAIEMGEDCDPPGKKCYMKDSYQEGTCDFECLCKDYIIPVCGNGYLEDDEKCEKDDDCPMFNYCNANCECISKIAPSENKTEEIIDETKENESNELIIEKELDSKTNETIVYEDFIVNESYFERENFNESFGIKITGAVTHVTKSVFGSLWDLIKGWLL